ncbi:MAG TPA: amidohydrolase [Longimicrobiales bacterium]|nr:amidohydrolase [Longimicrobiales bacterium]
MRRSFAIVMALLLASACSRPGADLVLLGGNIITVDGADRIAQAVAITGDRIVAVGTDDEIRDFVGADTEQVDLHGATVTPGLLDAHAHFSGGALDRSFVVDLSYPRVKSVSDIVATIAGEVAKREPGEWITGRGWDEGKLAELRYVYAADLDAVAPDNPVWLTHTMGHYGTANSAAMALAGVGGETVDPPGGTIDRRADGTLTGVFKESAQRLVSRLVPDFTPEQEREAIANLARAFNAEGMTGLKQPGMGQDTWDSFQQVMDQGNLTVRVFALWRPAQTTEAAQDLIDRKAATTRPYESTGDDHLISGGVKLQIDGSGGARTAWMHDEWNRDRTGLDEGNFGYPVIDPDTLRKILRMYHDAGLHISVHSIGDRAIDWTVDSYAEALEANPTNGLRHGIIHANIPTDHALDVMADLEKRYDAAYPEPQAGFTWWIGDTYAGNFGPVRAPRLNPFKTYLDRGILWAGGSDFSVTPFPARYGLWASVARETLLGVHGKNPWGMDESVDIRAALKSYTIWAARQMFLEDKIGSIEPGKYADLAVWDKDLYTVPTADLENLECQMTIFNGRIVYAREGSRVAVSR